MWGFYVFGNFHFIIYLSKINIKKIFFSETKWFGKKYISGISKAAIFKALYLLLDDKMHLPCER